MASKTEKTSERRARRRRLHHAAVAVALILFAALLGAAAASARPAASRGSSGWAKPWEARFVTPDNHEVVTDGSVDVTVQLAPGVKKFRALVDRSKVTGAFQVTAGGRGREATLKVGKTPGLGYGRHIIYVEALGEPGQTWWAQRRILIAHPGTGLLGAASVRRVPGAGVKVSATTAKPYFHTSLRVDGGRRIEIPGAGSRHRLRLSGDDGLHPGRNLIIIRALDGKNGRYETRRIPIVLPRDVPVAGAGGPHRAQQGRKVRFDGRGTNVARGVHAHYRWTIAHSPAGSKAKLRHATSPRPVLRPDQVGRYVLKLTVTGNGVAGGAHASAATASAAGETASVASDSATTTLEAAPPHGAIGVPIDTIDGAGVMLGTTRYPAPNEKDALQMMVIARGSLEVKSNLPYPNTVAGAEELLAAVKKLMPTEEDPRSENLVIIAKTISSTNNSSEAKANELINKALADIGARSVSQLVSNGAASCYDTVPCSVFSAIGVPGLSLGEGNVNGGLGDLRGHAWGDLHGYLQEELTGKNPFVYVSTERVPFDTGAETEDPATVTIGSNEKGSPLAAETFTSGKEEGGGWFVVLLQAGTLKTISSETFPNTASGLEKMHAALSPWSGSQNAFLIVRSIGKVSRVNSPAWDSVAADLQAFGGSSLYLNSLGSSASNQTYAQVGPGGTPGYPSPWTQVATGVRTGTGRLTGLLGYNALSQLYPAESIPPTTEVLAHPLEGTLPGVVSLPATAWPEESWAAPEKAVEKCIASLVIGNGGSLQIPIYRHYNNANASANWSGYASKLQGYSLKTIQGVEGCGSATEGQFKTVREQLLEEWPTISTVYSFFANLEKAVSEVDGEAQAKSVAEEVNQAISLPESTKVGFNRLGLASDTLWVASALFPEADAVAGPLNFLAGALGLAGELQQSTEENAQEQVSVSADKLSERLASQLRELTTNLGRDREIVLGDWSKLQIVARNANDITDAAANWEWTLPNSKKAVDSMMVSVRRQAYETLFPVAYSLFRLQAGTATLPTNPAQYQCVLEGADWTKSHWTPFEGIQQFGSVDVTVNGSGATEDWVYGKPDKSFVSHPYINVETASAEVLKKIFGPPKPKDEYQTAPLFNGAQFAIETYENGTANTIKVTHVAPGKHSVVPAEICQAS
ncbi:MAG TPA: hypothetical protein VMH33_07065 [Solirubrobacterales bacterium]|nr:hypothetical protein [Solirubrobacterales bacterium]